MKRRFIVEAELPEDPDHIVTAKYLQDVVTSAWADYENVKYDPVYIRVSEEPLVSLEYLQSLDNTTPPHIQEIIDARVLQPDEIRRIL